MILNDETSNPDPELKINSIAMEKKY